MIIINAEGCNKVNNFLFVLDWINPPIVNDKVELTNFPITFSDLIIVIKWLSHDSNEHVQHMDGHDKAH